MSRQKARIEALEKRALQSTDLSVLFIKFCSGGHGAAVVERIGMAHVVGVGRITPDEGETEEAFVRRAYAMRAAQRPLDQWTDDELEVRLDELKNLIEMQDKGLASIHSFDPLEVERQHGVQL